jgi:hypothetical protein
MEKAEIINYYNYVKSKTKAYINSLEKNDLDEIVYIGEEGYYESKGTRILGQIRHTYYHVGYLHCCIKIEKGETPEYLNASRYYEKIKNRQ